MDRSSTSRLIALSAAALAPAAAVLGVLAATGAAPIGWVAASIGAGLAVAALSGSALSRSISRRAERLEAVAEALRARRLPTHLLPDEGGAIGAAERHLLDAADTIVDETDSLAEQRDEFEAILRSMTEAVVVTGARGEVILLNGAARRIFALGAETDYRDRPLVELCRDPRLQEFVGRAMQSPDGGSAGAELMIQNVAPVYVSANAAAIKTLRGTVWVFVFHDITQLKSYETIRSDFIANLTHELRTPLSALYGYAETLIGGVDDRETELRFLRIIERQARRLARLLDDLISLSDLERGLKPLKMEQLDAGRVIAEAAELMQEQAARQELALEVRCPPELPKLAGDRDRLQQVMLNLLDNAIKYTPRGGKITVEAHTAEGTDGAAGKPGVALSVADTGEGIPSTDIPRLTERFYRVDRARSRELGGTGLGLAIVKHIVQLHHGALKIDSKLREGTTVAIWIPTASGE
ncbi:MAG TPA: ATP-binding protein [Candidatus Binataceae bacterium]|nr:ATP-binding protein [Candidatus Binataceae bacterium]